MSLGQKCFSIHEEDTSKDSREESNLIILALGRATGGSEHTLSSKGLGVCSVQGKAGGGVGRERKETKAGHLMSLCYCQYEDWKLD